MSRTPSRLALAALHVAAMTVVAATMAVAQAPCSPRLAVDERAHCFAATPAGERAVPLVGQNVPAAAALEVKQAHAALTPSFARYVIRTAGVAAAQEALSRATPDAYPKYTGKTLAQWRTDWLAAIGAGAKGG